MFHSVSKNGFHSACFMNEAQWTNCNSTPNSLGFIHVILYTVLCLLWLFFVCLFKVVLPVTDGQLIDQYFMQEILKASFWGMLHSVYFPSILWELLFFFLKMFTGQKHKDISRWPLCVYYGSLNLYCFPNSPETSCWTSYESQCFLNSSR